MAAKRTIEEIASRVGVTRQVADLRIFVGSRNRGATLLFNNLDKVFDVLSGSTF
jgi:ribosome biogenesis GTPase A